jgi:hypothetical protein
MREWKALNERLCHEGQECKVRNAIRATGFTQLFFMAEPFVQLFSRGSICYSLFRQRIKWRKVLFAGLPTYSNANPEPLRD